MDSKLQKYAQTRTVRNSWNLTCLCILLLGALVTQLSAAATTVSPDPVSGSGDAGLGASANGSTAGHNDSHPDDHHNTSGGYHREHSVHVVALEFEHVKEPLIFTIVILLAGLFKIAFHHADFLSSKIPESCMLIVLGTIFGAIIQFSALSEGFPDLFNPHMFFVFLLPPIILESAYSLYDRTFSDNLGTVLLFAGLGTIVSFFLVGLTLYGLMLSGAMGEVPDINLVQILVFSALIVAVDPVAVLAVFTEIGVNDVLYFIVFGESLLNDGVTVVLYKVMQALNLMEVITVEQIVLGIVKFVVVVLGGLLLGIIAGVISAFLTKFTQHVGVVQPLVIYAMAYLGFLVSELFEVSGIISIIACGLVQRHYAFSNIAYKSRTTVKYFTKVLASASEIIIFLFLGLDLVSDDHEWNTGFVLWTLVLCTAYRFLVTFGIACLVNRFDTMRVRLISYEEMFMIAFGGLRGAVAFSLAALLDENALPMKNMFVTTTMVMILFTVFFQGITIKPLVKLLSITLAPHKNESMYCELSNHVSDHLMAGIEGVVGFHGRNHIREKLEQFDAEHIKKWLMNEPDVVDANLEDFYNKIVIKEHYKNLQLCGAVNVPENANIPRIDTDTYLNSLAINREATLAAQKSMEIEDKDQDKESPVVRRRRNTSTPSSPTIGIADLKTLRGLLISPRASRFNLHNFDRNIKFDDTHNLQSEIIKRSERNRRLEHLMSTIHPPLERSLSWKEKDSAVARDRGADVPDKRSGKRAVSVDLGATSVSYRPLMPKPTSPGSPGSPLDSVFEENEDASTTNQKPEQSKKGKATPGKEEEVEGHDEGQTGSDESRPLMSDVDPPPTGAVPSETGSGIARGQGSKSSRHRLQRQDDIKPSGPDEVV
ncbi:Na(+)/H(+) exchanger beta-like [Littorina saxatilis]|uniref:Na(+)/H(+) exchanger beta-like n=1 Tax=Littorina saxatilis TaxID=31220 RepID=UPI0038B67E62